MSTTGIFILHRDPIACVKHSDKNCFHSDTWHKINQNQLKNPLQPVNKVRKRTKSKITPFRHNKEKIASVIVISSRVM